MGNQWITAAIGAAGFAGSSVAIYLHLRHRLRASLPLLYIASLLAITTNALYFGGALRTHGVIETFRHSYESTLLLAGLTGLMGLAVHLSASLRGLDGFLFAMATMIQLGSLTVIHQTGNEMNYKPWFVSHSLAFAVSATCFLAGGSAGAAYLIINHLLRTRRASTLVGQVAPLESLEGFGRLMIMVGFPLFTYGVLTGICELVRTDEPGAWLRDPLIVMTFLTWMVYAGMIAMMWLRPHFRGRLAAASSAGGMVLIAVVFLLVEWISPQHR